MARLKMVTGALLGWARWKWFLVLIIVVVVVLIFRVVIIIILVTKGMNLCPLAIKY